MSIEQLIKEIKKRATFITKNPCTPARIWSEEESIDGRQAKALVIVLKTSGCRWNACSMCGYFRESLKTVSQHDIVKQMDYALSRYRGEEIIKIFTSGSFLDTKEVHPDTQRKIMERLAKLKTLEIVSVESRPEYIDIERLKNLVRIIYPRKLEVSIGLESANDKILKDAINKGFSFSDYLESAKVVKEANALLKTYLLLKPPFLTEKEAIDDCIYSIGRIKRITDSVSLNPTSVHRYTLVEYLWERKDYRPPWLWSVIKVLREGKKILGSKRIKSDVTGGGTRRGAHNCGKCDRKILNCIRKFSLDQNEEHLREIYCECLEEWKDILHLESFAMGVLV